jgi:hypothetical protein
MKLQVHSICSAYIHGTRFVLSPAQIYAFWVKSSVDIELGLVLTGTDNPFI